MTIQEARQIIWKKMKEDPDFQRVYEDNVACLLMDFQADYGTRLDFREKEVRNICAHRIVEFIFKED